MWVEDSLGDLILALELELRLSHQTETEDVNEAIRLLQVFVLIIDLAVTCK